MISTIADKWWDSNNKGPIFLYTGNEGDITEFWNNCGFLFEIAPHFGALILFAEHVRHFVQLCSLAIIMITNYVAHL